MRCAAQRFRFINTSIDECYQLSAKKFIDWTAEQKWDYGNKKEARFQIVYQGEILKIGLSILKCCVRRVLATRDFS